MMLSRRSLRLENNKKVLSLLSLAAKAGRIKSGEYMTEESVKGYKARLVIVADDASDNTKKQFKNMCDYYNVPMIIIENKETLGHAIGKELRASVVVNDDGFANAILKQVSSTDISDQSRKEVF